MNNELYNLLITSISKTIYKSINEAYNVDDLRTCAKNNTLYNFINIDDDVKVKLINMHLGSIMPADCITLKVGQEYTYSELTKQMLDLKLNRTYNELFFHIISKICIDVKFRETRNIWWGDYRNKQRIVISKLDVTCTNKSTSDFSFIINEIKIDKPDINTFLGTWIALSYKNNDPFDIDCIITLSPAYCKKQAEKFGDRLEKNSFKDPLQYKKDMRNNYLYAYKGEKFGDKEFGKHDKTSGIYKQIVNDMIISYKYGMDHAKNKRPYSSNKSDIWTEDIVRDYIIKEVRTHFYKREMDGSFYKWFKAKYPEFYEEMERIGVIAQIK